MPWLPRGFEVYGDLKGTLDYVATSWPPVTT
jgi:hypothetical protein